MVELRRYAIQPGERDRFALTFDAYFPEAFQQIGGIVFGQGLERATTAWFTVAARLPELRGARRKGCGRCTAARSGRSTRRG
jgi:hypothetical protein